MKTTTFAVVYAAVLHIVALIVLTVLLIVGVGPADQEWLFLAGLIGLGVGVGVAPNLPGFTGLPSSVPASPTGATGAAPATTTAADAGIAAPPVG